MRRAFENAGKIVAGFARRSSRKSKSSNIPDDDPANSTYDGNAPQEFEEGPADGCFLTVMLAVFVGLALVLIVLDLLNNSSDDPNQEQNSAEIETQDDTLSVDDPAPEPEAGSFYTDPENADLVIPAAGTWAIDNGMFVPNCGPENAEPDTAPDSGTIDVWASGALLELKGQDGVAIVFERTAVSDSEAIYEGDVGLIGMELVFGSPAHFDASIVFEGDGTCIRRLAEGSLAEGDADLQHGAAQPPDSAPSLDVVIDQAGEGTIAVVAISGETYEFFPEGPAGTCEPDLFGGFHAVLYSEGFVDSLNIDLIPDGSRVSTATMKLQDLDLDLVADAEGEWAAVEDGTSTVLDFTIDGNTASGIVFFINEDRAFNAANYPLESIEATFTVTCGS